MNRQSLIVPTGRLRPISLVLAALVLVGSVTSSVVSWATGLPSDVAVRIGGQDITVTQLDRRVAVLSAIYGVTAPESGKKLDEFRRAAAKSIAVSTVLEQVAARRKVVIANKTVEDELSKIIDEQNGSRATFVQFLGQKGLKESDVIDELRRAKVTQQLFADVTADVPAATKADAKAEYEKRQDEIRTAEQRRLANIVVKTQAEAQAVVKRLQDGDSFADVASSTSLDTSTSQKGGDLGQAVAQSGLETAYGKAAFSVGKGEVFGPVKTASGWNVGKVLSVTPGKRLSLTEVESTLVTALTNRRKADAWTDWLNRQVRSADVRYADDYRPKDLTVSSDDASQGGATP